MGSGQSSQKKKRYSQFEHQSHFSAATPPRRRPSSAQPSPVYPAPSSPLPHTARDASAPPLPPTPDADHIVETNPFRTPSTHSHRRTQSHGARVVPQPSQILAGTGHIRMPAVPATVEEAPPMPMPMPVPHPAPAPHRVQPPIPAPGTERIESLMRRNSREDPLTMLYKYDTVIVVCLASPGSSSC
jgi:hypothetical protein